MAPHHSLVRLVYCAALLLVLSGTCQSIQDGGTSSSKATLTFHAQCEIVAEPFCDDPQALRAFLEQPLVRDFFLSAGGRRQFQVLPVDPDDPSKDSIAGLWRQACQKYYGNDTLPQPLIPATAKKDHPIHSRNPLRPRHPQIPGIEISAVATETEAPFPGFTIINTVLSGCQLYPPQTSSIKATRIVVGNKSQKKHGRIPAFFRSRKVNYNNDDCGVKDSENLVYKFYLIGDSKRLIGSPPVVWLVRKLMGDETAEEDTASLSSSSQPYKPSETRGITQVSIYTQDDALSTRPISSDDTNKSSDSQSASSTVGFRVDIDCTVQIEFPKLLLRLLPASRSKVEERGTKAVRKAILQDATTAVEAIQQLWITEQERLMEEQKMSIRPAEKGRGLPTFHRLFGTLGNKSYQLTE